MHAPNVLAPPPPPPPPPNLAQGLPAPPPPPPPGKGGNRVHRGHRKPGPAQRQLRAQTESANGDLFADEFAKNLATLVDNPEFADVYLIVEGEFYSAPFPTALAGRGFPLIVLPDLTSALRQEDRSSQSNPARS